MMHNIRHVPKNFQDILLRIMYHTHMIIVIMYWIPIVVAGLWGGYLGYAFYFVFKEAPRTG